MFTAVPITKLFVVCFLFNGCADGCVGVFITVGESSQELFAAGVHVTNLNGKWTYSAISG